MGLIPGKGYQTGLIICSQTVCNYMINCGPNGFSMDVFYQEGLANFGKKTLDIVYQVINPIFQANFNADNCCFYRDMDKQNEYQISLNYKWIY